MDHEHVLDDGKCLLCSLDLEYTHEVKHETERKDKGREEKEAQRTQEREAQETTQGHSSKEADHQAACMPCSTSKEE